MIYLYAFFVLSFLNAFKDISTKQSLKSLDAGVMTGICSLAIIIVTIPFLIREGIPSHIELSSFIWIVAGGGLFYYFGKYFNFQSLSLWDISLITPMKWLVTIATVFSSMLLLGETVNLWGFLGIMLTIGGTYFLAVEKWHTTFIEPIRALITNPGSRMFLIAVCFYGFTVTFDRMGIHASSIWFWSFLMNSIVFLMSLRNIYIHRKTLKKNMQTQYKALILLIILHIWIYFSQMYIVSEVIAPYTSAFKSASALFAVMFGGWFFQEKHLFQRFIWACIILSGIILISFFG